MGSLASMTVERFTFDVRLLGGAARRGLVTGEAARVLAVFQRSFYLETMRGALVCFGPMAMGAGPLNALCELPDGLDWRASGLRVDGPAHMSQQVLSVAGRFEFTLSGVESWSPPVVVAGDISRGLEMLDALPGTRDPDRGLALLIAPDAMPQGAVLKAAAPAVTAFRLWLDTMLAGGNSPVPAAVRGLIGLGPGLTPSGDDFIGGALITLDAFQQFDTAEALANWVLPIAEGATGAISLAHLHCAARGEGAAALHGAIAAIAGGGDGLKECLEAIDAIGHSSGWDALAGAVTVLRALGTAPAF